MKDYHPPMYPGMFYHVYNRGNNRENIFYQPRNYDHFLKLYKKYLVPWLDSFVYSLLPNHFHLLVRVKAKEHFLLHPAFLKTSSLPDEPDFPSFQNLESLGPDELIHLPLPLEKKCQEEIAAFISEQFRVFFMAYSKAINAQEGRTGSLFQKNFKRIAVENEAYFTNLIFNIHANAQLHGICDDFKSYPFSSYSLFLMQATSFLEMEQVVNWFGSMAAFVAAHHAYMNFHGIDEWGIEED